MEIYYGQIACEATYATTGQPCRNKAYYLFNEKHVCGIHSKGGKRVELTKNKKAVQEDKDKELVEHKKSVDETTKLNKSKKIQGKVICTKMAMMKKVPLIEGFMNVFPNFKHQNRKDGFGCSSLSPMSMGPIDHGQPGLPVCKNLENYFQSNKCYPSELGEHGRPKECFYKTQREMYEDPIPHRHKETSGKQNKPEFSVWLTKDRVEKHFSYIESRQFYCNYYERFALKDKNFLKLKAMLKDGTNLCICGYDAYLPDKDIEKHYLDPSRPFGHELVLYTLLTCEQEDFPWRRHKTEDF